jgi:hypothetical protein
MEDHVLILVIVLYVYVRHNGPVQYVTFLKTQHHRLRLIQQLTLAVPQIHVIMEVHAINMAIVMCVFAHHNLQAQHVHQSKPQLGHQLLHQVLELHVQTNHVEMEEFVIIMEVHMFAIVLTVIIPVQTVKQVSQ